MKLKKILVLFFCLNSLTLSWAFDNQIIWQIGTSDNSAADLALGPSEYKQFLAQDFGYEDRYFLINKSVARNDFPYVLPGPDDSWGGTSPTSGWRTHEVNILFTIDKLPQNGEWKFVVDLVDCNPNRSVVKITVNNNAEKKFEIAGHSNDVLEGNTDNAKEQILEFPIASNTLKEGGNCLTISVLEGGWMFLIAFT